MGPTRQEVKNPNKWLINCFYFNVFFCHNVFTDSALWAGSVIESPCPSFCRSVCLSVKLRNTHFQREIKLLIKRCIANFGLWWHTFFFLSVSMIFRFFLKFFWVFVEPSLLQGWPALYWRAALHCTAQTGEILLPPPPPIRPSVRPSVCASVSPYVCASERLPL